MGAYQVEKFLVMKKLLICFAAFWVLWSSQVAVASEADRMNECVSLAAKEYGIPSQNLMKIINYHATHRGGIGVMGIPVAWVPYLERYGIQASSLHDSCQNIVAGAWILAFSAKLENDGSNGGRATLGEKAKKWQGLIKRYAQESGVPIGLINAVIEQESGFDEKAVSRVGAIGLMQLMPSTAEGLGVDPFDPAENIRGGVSYLRSLLTQYGGNVSLSLAAYNAGPSAVSKYGGIPPYAETEAYVKNILSKYQSN